MKKITTEQVKAIKDLIYQLNAPVQAYISVNTMLEGLPECTDEDEKALIPSPKEFLPEEEDSLDK